MTDPLHQSTDLRCVGCERPATPKAQPDAIGYWLCKCCEHDMRWAMAWQARIMDASNAG